MNDETFEYVIEKTIDAIQNSNFKTAKLYLQDAFSLDESSPKIHNLLGVIAEMSYEKGKAIKHFRAAYGLDPSFKPAVQNLEKITTYEYKYSKNNLYF